MGVGNRVILMETKWVMNGLWSLCTSSVLVQLCLQLSTVQTGTSLRSRAVPCCRCNGELTGFGMFKVYSELDHTTCALGLEHLVFWSSFYLEYWCASSDAPKKTEKLLEVRPIARRRMHRQLSSLWLVIAGVIYPYNVGMGKWKLCYMERLTSLVVLAQFHPWCDPFYFTGPCWYLFISMCM